MSTVSLAQFFALREKLRRAPRTQPRKIKLIVLSSVHHAYAGSQTLNSFYINLISSISSHHISLP